MKKCVFVCFVVVAFVGLSRGNVIVDAYNVSGPQTNGGGYANFIVWPEATNDGSMPNDPGPHGAAQSSLAPGNASIFSGPGCNIETIIVNGQPQQYSNGPNNVLYARWGAVGDPAGMSHVVRLYDYHDDVCGESNWVYLMMSGNSLPPTNCIDTVTVCNNDIQQHTYQIYHHNQPYSTITVAGGGCWTAKINNPGCGPYEWYAQIADYIYGGPTNSSPPPLIPISGTPSNTGGGNNSPYSPPMGGGGGNGAPTIPPYTNAPPGTNSASNGPVYFGPGTGLGNPTNGVNNGTLEAGINALYTAAVQDEQGVVSAIEKADYDNQLAIGGVSNLLSARIAVALDGMSNELSNIDSNTALLTNLFGTNVFGSNIYDFFYSNFMSADALNAAGQRAASADAAVFGSISNGVPRTGTTTVGTYDGGSWTVNASVGGFNYLFDMGLGGTNDHGFASLAAFIRNLIFWLATAFFYVWLVDYCLKYVKAAPSMQQMKLPNVNVEGFTFGGNVGIFAYVVYMSAMIAIMGILPQAVLGMLTVEHAASVTTLLGDPFAGASGAASMAVALADQFVPLAYLVGLVGTVLVDMVSISAIYWFVSWLWRVIAG